MATASTPSTRPGSHKSGVYEAIVLGHVVGSRSGQLTVRIKGDPADSSVDVSYASPFYGKTYGTDSQDTSPSNANTTGQSYGFWMVPPDIGNTVLVTFVEGDTTQRGYWFACVYDSMSHGMVPGIGRNVGNAADTNADPGIAQYQNSSQVLPVVEASAGNSEAFKPDAITNTQRYPHEFQTMVLVGQGLDRDPVRGAISSSSLREAPSNVFGFSTPGRSATGNNPQVTQQLPADQDATQATIARTGGHTFVMDDGDVNGVDQLVRLRTAGGHQVLMNDTKKILYIASSTGNQWLEFSDDGAINIFGAAGINMRSKGPMNFHSDSMININSAGTLNMNADMGIKMSALTSIGISALVSCSVQSDGFLKLSALGAASLTGGATVSVSSLGVCNVVGEATLLLNSGPPVPPLPSIPTTGSSLPDVTWAGSGWQYAPGAVQSICTVVPAHEPWIDPGTGERPAPVTSGGSGLVGAAVSLGAGAAASAF